MTKRLRNSIVYKLFLLTVALFTVILGALLITQTLFFEKFYIDKKTNQIQSSLEAFKQEYLNSDQSVQTTEKWIQQFYQDYNTWVTPLDHLGYIVQGSDKENHYFEIDVQLHPGESIQSSNRVITIPLYLFEDMEKIRQGNFFIRKGTMIMVQAIQKDSELIPYRISVAGNKVTWENNQIALKEHEIVSKLESPELESEEFPSIYLNGVIKEVRLLAENETPELIYNNQLFLDQIKKFQANLIFGDEALQVSSPQMTTLEENDVSFKVFILPTHAQGGEPAYLIAMTSLQPVDEAVSMVQAYYGYILIFVIVLVLLSSFLYSKWIARPLLNINRTAKKIADLDFSEKLPVSSDDEISDLSRSINELSVRLNTHINQLEHDIEKEKQLEQTRKEFISGVSHELKTPLSVIQSCLTIMQDGVASHKRDYYFKAMEDEVHKMDHLIVDMLELAKYESGTYKMQMDTFYIDTVINDICTKLSLEMKDKQLQLITRLQPIEVVGNQHRIEQVIINFITNAIRYTPEKECIIVSTEEHAHQVKVSIENKGINIPVEQLDRIWDRFYRGEPSRHRATGGTGLGLAISKNILEIHQSEYGVKNTEDGVLFYFYLNTKV